MKTKSVSSTSKLAASNIPSDFTDWTDSETKEIILKEAEAWIALGIPETWRAAEAQLDRTERPPSAPQYNKVETSDSSPKVKSQAEKTNRAYQCCSVM